MPKRVFATDCEGPISKNDNAYELTQHFIPDGDKLFSLVSKYDDVQADVIHRPNYKAGDTLRLILPFLRARGVTNEKMVDFSSKNVLLVPGAADTLKFVRDIMPSYIVSTSFEHYVGAVCGLTDFPFENVYCTRLDMDRYDMSLGEERKIRKLRREIVEMPMIEIPQEAKSLADFPERDQKTIERLDEIFWKEISSMRIGRMLKEVNPIGGVEKAKAVKDIVKKEGTNLAYAMYVGDSITDVQSFQLVRNAGGLTVSFNGNAYAIREAEFAILSGNTYMTSQIADVFSTSGKTGVWNWVDELNALLPYEGRVKPNPKYFPQVEIITDENRERLAEESSAFRKTVRGEAIGKLG